MHTRQWMIVIGLMSGLNLLGTSARAAPSATLCTPTEKTYFHCPTTTGRIVALCGTEADDQLSSLYYRFGKAGNIELGYPSRAVVSPREAFQFSRYTRYHVSMLAVAFTNGSYKYTIFADANEEGPRPVTDYGVRVTGAKSTEIRCAKPVTDHLFSLEDLLPHAE